MSLKEKKVLRNKTIVTIIVTKKKRREGGGNGVKERSEWHWFADHDLYNFVLIFLLDIHSSI